MHGRYISLWNIFKNDFCALLKTKTAEDIEDYEKLLSLVITEIFIEADV